jgi:hypothetical protein
VHRVGIGNKLGGTCCEINLILISKYYIKVFDGNVSRRKNGTVTPETCWNRCRFFCGAVTSSAINLSLMRSF